MDASSVGSQPDVLREEFQALSAEVRNLSRRVSQLENAAATEPYQPPPLTQLKVSSDLVPAMGKSLLAIAGAYLLRTFTDLGVLPPAIGVSLGIVYAAAWLWSAARSKKKISGRLYALASMLILAPLLWEAVDRLHAIPAWAAASVIALFAVASSRRPQIAPVTSVACALMALASLIGLHYLTAFSLSLLAVAASAELAQVDLRWMVALLADGAVIIYGFVIARAQPDGYPPVSLRAALLTQVLLVLIYAAAFSRRREFTFFEIAQGVCAFLIGAGGAFYLTKAATPVAWFLLAASALSYALVLFGQAPDRNRRTFAIFSVALALAGTYAVASGLVLVAIWSALGTALAFTHLAAFHAWIYLWSGAIVSSVAMQARQRIWDDANMPLTLDALVILIGALVAYFALSRANRIGPAFAVALNGSLIAAALASRFAPSALVLTIFALSLAWTGVRAARPELVWLTYTMMAIAAAKILLHDFAQGTITLVISLLAYGLALILLPRILAGRPSGQRRFI